jgi:hypothetical protein
MRPSIILSAAAALAVVGIAASDTAFARGGGSHTHHAAAPAGGSSQPKSTPAVRTTGKILTPVPSKTSSPPHRHRRVIVVGAPYDATPTCVQILPSGRHVRVRCSSDVVW